MVGCRVDKNFFGSWVIQGHFEGWVVVGGRGGGVGRGQGSYDDCKDVAMGQGENLLCLEVGVCIREKMGVDRGGGEMGGRVRVGSVIAILMVARPSIGGR